MSAESSRRRRAMRLGAQATIVERVCMRRRDACTSARRWPASPCCPSHQQARTRRTPTTATNKPAGQPTYPTGTGSTAVCSLSATKRGGIRGVVVAGDRALPVVSANRNRKYAVNLHSGTSVLPVSVNAVSNNRNRKHFSSTTTRMNGDRLPLVVADNKRLTSHVSIVDGDSMRIVVDGFQIPRRRETTSGGSTDPAITTRLHKPKPEVHNFHKGSRRCISGSG